MRLLISLRASSLTPPERFDSPLVVQSIALRYPHEQSLDRFNYNLIAASYFGIASNDIYLKLGYARIGLCD